jgi:hypothetical protein
MAQLQTADSLTKMRRQEVFRLLVTGQDYGMSVTESRKMAASRFGLDPDLVRRIEQEGLQAHWAPLQAAPAR